MAWHWLGNKPYVVTGPKWIKSSPATGYPLWYHLNKKCTVPCTQKIIQRCHTNILASQITDNSTIGFTAFSVATKKSNLCIASPLWWGIHWWPVDSPDKGPVMWKVFPCHNVTWDKTYLLDTLYPKHLYVSNGMLYLWIIHEDFLWLCKKMWNLLLEGCWLHARCLVSMHTHLNSSPPGQNGGKITDDILRAFSSMKTD